MRLNLKMLTLKQVMSQIRSEDWLVFHGRSKRRIVPCLHPSSSQEVPEVCFCGQSVPISGSSLRPYTLAPHVHKLCGCCSGSTDGLILDQSERVAVGHQYVILAHIKELGLRLNTKKSVLSPLQKTICLCVVWDSTNDAGTSVPCLDRVEPHGSHESKRRPVIHCQAVSKTAGSDGSCFQCDTSWPAEHETPRVVAQDQGVLPEGIFTSHALG